MKCKNCNEEYDQMMFDICPYCLYANEEIEEGPEVDSAQKLIETAEKSCKHIDDGADISHIAELSGRSKNALKRHGIFTFGMLREYVENNELLDMKNFGEHSKREVMHVLKKYSKEPTAFCGKEEAFIDAKRLGNVDDYLEVSEAVIGGENPLVCTHIKEAEEILSEYGDGINEGVDISDIPELSNRSKNALKRHGIFTFGMLLEYVKNNELSDIRNLGEQSKREILYMLGKYAHEAIVFFDEEEEANRDVTMFKDIHSQLCELGVDILIALGVSTRTINSIIQSGITQIRGLKDISVRVLQKVVGYHNIEKFKELENCLAKSINELLGDLLRDFENEDDFQVALMKAEGFTLQEIGEIRGCTRERVRQIIKKFNQKLEPLVNPIINNLMKTKGYVADQEILDLYNNSEYDKILINWCRANERLEYLDFANIYIVAGESKHANEEKILNIANDFIGEGIDLYENMGELEMTLKKAGFPYLYAGDIINLLQKNNYKVYGSYVTSGRHSYGHLCARIVAKRFPNGIKLYEGTDLDLLRKYALEEYGDIGLSDDNRALSSRISDFLILSGRGMATAKENVHVDLGLLEEIREFIDNEPEREIYYSHIFSEYEGMLRMMSNIHNYNFLHGALMMYYPEEYDYTRDYLIKKGTGFVSGRLCDKLSRFILEKGKPVHRNDIKRKLTGMTDIVLSNAVNSSDDLFVWDYNTYYSTELMDVKNEELNYLKEAIQIILDSHGGYCSDSLLFSWVQANNPELLAKNSMEAESNLYYFCAKKMGDLFDFRRPHICAKGLLQEVSVKNVALYMMGYPERLSYRSYIQVSEELMWSPATTGIVFSEIEQDYIRISEEEYLRKELFSLSESELMGIEKSLLVTMNYDFISLITFDKWECLPEIGFTWNAYLLHAIVTNYSNILKIIEPRVRDRRFERGIVVLQDSKFNDYIDVVIHMLKLLGKEEISENNLGTLMVMNGLAYKMIPHEVYITERLMFKDEKFVII